MDVPNHLVVVQITKGELEHRGVDLAGPCGAFEVTKRVAWLLRSEGAGLLAKSDGNNCQGYSVDTIVYPDGTAKDCLRNSGGTNEPAWDDSPTVDPARYRPPIDPGDQVAQPPAPPAPPPPAPPPAPEPDPQLDVLIAAIDREILGLISLREGMNALGQKIDDLRAHGITAHLRL